jgi:rRNA-processing protein FCF1
LKIVLFDSSFLIAVMQNPTTWYEDMLEKIGSFKPAILNMVQMELESIKERGGAKAKYASLAKELSSTFTIIRTRSKVDHTDDAIISYAKENRVSVATIDSELIERLKALKIATITLRKGRVYA